MTEALLRGRYYSQMRKLGIVGLTISAASGVITYFAHYKRKEASLKNYLSTLTEEHLVEIDKRVHKYAGLHYNERYPNLPMYELEGDEAKEGFEKFKEKLTPWLLSWRTLYWVLVEFDADIGPSLAKVQVASFPGEVNLYKSKKDKLELDAAYKRVLKAAKAYKEKNGSDISDVDFEKMMQNIASRLGIMDKATPRLPAFTEDSLLGDDFKGRIQVRD